MNRKAQLLSFNFFFFFFTEIGERNIPKKIQVRGSRENQTQVAREEARVIAQASSVRTG